VAYIEKLYLSSPETILDTVHSEFSQYADTVKHIMVIAHNPGLEILSDELSGNRTGAMPTGAVASFTIDADDFAVVHSANATLKLHCSPKELRIN